jgi:PPP family 3-phenylpropionic acid transporter
MVLALPIFFLFAIYGVVAVYLPVVLTGMGYTATQVGFLLGIFEGAGVILPLIVSPLIEKKGQYGLFLILMGLVMALVPFPMVKIMGFGATAAFLSLYSFGYKGAVPLSDSLIQKFLTGGENDYGKVRVAGSIGYVVMTLLLQRFVPAGTARQYMVWMVASAGLFALSLFFVPGILASQGKNISAEENSPSPISSDKKEGIWQTLAQFPPIFWMGLWLLFLGFFGLTPVTKMLALYTTEFLHSNGVGALSAISAASEIPFMFFSGRFLRRYGSLNLLVFCTALVGVRMLLYIVFPNMTGAVLGQLLNSVTYGLYHPAAVVFVAQYAPKGKLMISMSLYSIFALGLASVLGNSLGGWMIDSFGYPVLFTAFAVFPLVGVLVYLFVRKKL